jgi:hypothetical protein
MAIHIGRACSPRHDRQLERSSIQVNLLVTGLSPVIPRPPPHRRRHRSHHSRYFRRRLRHPCCSCRCSLLSSCRLWRPAASSGRGRRSCRSHHSCCCSLLSPCRLLQPAACSPSEHPSSSTSWLWSSFLALTPPSLASSSQLSFPNPLCCPFATTVFLPTAVPPLAVRFWCTCHPCHSRRPRLQVCRLSAVIPILSKAFLLYVSLSPFSVSCSFVFQLVFSHTCLAKDSASCFAMPGHGTFVRYGGIKKNVNFYESQGHNRQSYKLNAGKQAERVQVAETKCLAEIQGL